MKHSRAFLGVTTALLAVAGIAAAKAHRLPLTKLWYYTGSLPNQHLCRQADFTTRCGTSQVGMIKCFYYTNPGIPTGAILTLYTRQVSVVTCGAVAKYNQQ